MSHLNDSLIMVGTEDGKILSKYLSIIILIFIIICIAIDLVLGIAEE